MVSSAGGVVVGDRQVGDIRGRHRRADVRGEDLAHLVGVDETAAVRGLDHDAVEDVDLLVDQDPLHPPTSWPSLHWTGVPGRRAV